MHLIHTSIMIFLPKYYHHQLMVLDTPVSLGASGARDDLFLISAPPPPQPGKYKDMCSTLHIQKIYRERVSYFLF